jgi:hypothetical protein
VRPAAWSPVPRALCIALVGCVAALASCRPHADGLPGGTEEILLPYPPDAGSVTWNGWAGEFVRDYCVQCHNPSAPCGGSGCHSPGDSAIAPDFRIKADVVALAPTIRCGISVTQDPSWSCGGTAPKTFPIFLGQNALPADEQRDLMVDWFKAGCP